ncbi:TMEM143 family protein [Microseira wollei]|uniref:DUF3754 domain-containing protein n=1 Tax=Microseira wollei NIES-4236 TaxID=2530354 RepID=A0AAV3X4N7_9CYAN|nr:TMEM143 family protein [Microseira wollei]GET37238.1 hypothetical protein MiSe_19910 [Microseira wollei NIES-4236]
MAVYQDREAFIPYRRSDLIELCVESGHLAAADVPKFRNFCKILSAYYHFNSHQKLEFLKDNYAPFNPDADTKFINELTPDQKAKMPAQLLTVFENILTQANYIPLTQKKLQLALQEKSLIELKTQINFEDFDQIVCYYRGDRKQKIIGKKLWKNVEKTIQVFERVVLLLKFKNYRYFEAKKIQIKKLNFKPGKIYIYFYKNIPKYDLEFLFPNIKLSMTWKDRLLFGIPAVGAGIPLLLRVIPQLFLIVGVILFVFFGQSILVKYINEEQVRNIMPILVAFLSLIVGLGGFAFRQYNNYKNKKIKFQKEITDTLFFRNLANNARVFSCLIDDAEEEECKEIILVYYHLMTSKNPLNPEQLDDRIEAWMAEKFGTKIDFDINGPLRNLEAIRGKIVKEGEAEASTPEIPLLTYDNQGFCQVPSLDDAKTIVDYVWDNAFLYAK